MNRKHGAWAATVVWLAAATAIEAHHSISMFELSNPIWAKGTVVSYEAINPHAIIVLEGTTGDGAVRRWTVEGPTLRRLARMGVGADFVQTGDVLDVCGFPPKAEFSRPRASPDPRRFAPDVFHGHVLLLPDGQMRHWGPYGKIENCIREGDRPETWVEFLNTDPMARAAWCGGHAANVVSLAPQAFVDEVDSRLRDPCR